MKRKVMAIVCRHGWRCKNALAGVFAKQKLQCLITAWMLLLGTACGGSPPPATPAAAAPEQDELDSAIRAASDYLDENIPGGSKIVVLNIQSDSDALSDYIIDELIANAVNDKSFSVVDRQQLDLIRQEQNFQWSGEVDDNLALEVGRFFGAQTIVSGRVSKLGERYRMTIRALEVQTAEVQGQYNRNIAANATINDLMATGRRTVAATTATPVVAVAAATPAVAPVAATITSSTIGWKSNVDGGNQTVIRNTSASFAFSKETIQGQEKDVLIAQVNIAPGSVWRIGEFILENETILQRLRTGSGIRFKVLGDGQEGWKLLVPTRETSADFCWYEATIINSNNRVVDVNISFSSLRQPGWGREAPFVKNNITRLLIQRYAGDDSSLSGSSTLRIFDFEIY